MSCYICKEPVNNIVNKTHYNKVYITKCCNAKLCYKCWVVNSVCDQCDKNCSLCSKLNRIGPMKYVCDACLS